MKYLLIILLFISCVVKAQNTKLYAVRFNINGTTDSFWVNPVICAGVYNSAGSYLMPCIDSMNQISGYNFPQSAGLFFRRADGIYSNLVFPGNTAIPQSQVTDLTTDLAGKLATNGNGSSLTGLTKTQVGLANVDNTSDANKPVSSATQTALNLKANLSSPTFTGTVGGITATMVGLGNVTNESKATMFTSPTFTGNAVLGTPASGNFSTGIFTWPTFNQSTTGSAATLTTPRTIQGVSFNGSANINIINGTGFVKATGTTLSYDNSTYQPLATNLTAIGALANTSGFLKNNGSGVFTYDNPAGSGTVTDVSIVTANGVSGSVATSTSTPAITLTLGAITPTTVNGVTITDLLPKTTTSGVGSSPTASSTTTVTHNLGRVPSVIRIYGYGSFTSNAAATATTSSMGIFSSSGNFCVYQRYGAAITTTQAGLSSNTFAILLATGGGNFISGVIQNVTSTQFDIVWTETGTATAQVYLWEAQ